MVLGRDQTCRSQRGVCRATARDKRSTAGRRDARVMTRTGCGGGPRTGPGRPRGRGQLINRMLARRVIIGVQAPAGGCRRGSCDPPSWRGGPGTSQRKGAGTAHLGGVQQRNSGQDTTSSPSPRTPYMLRLVTLFRAARARRKTVVLTTFFLLVAGAVAMAAPGGLLTPGGGGPQPGLTTAGPVNPSNGFPDWYRDVNGIDLAPCDNAQDPNCGGAVPTPDPTAPTVF